MRKQRLRRVRRIAGRGRRLTGKTNREDKKRGTDGKDRRRTMKLDEQQGEGGDATRD
uniref:Uncharacterized protein n=1 Tax=Cucumis melo TaxID=3656 RepID=A0A9I9D4C5_CUCME